MLGWDQFLAGGFDAVQDRSLAREAEKSAADRHEYDSGAEGVCAADFLGEEVENLVCGGRLDRVQRVRAADPGLEAVATVQHVAAALPTATKALTKPRKGKADFEIADEHDLQDLLYFALRSVFEDVRREEWTPSAAGGAKRVDLVTPDVRVMVEVKFVRNARHGRSNGDELKIDIESYHSHPACGTLIAVVWDPSRWLPDPQALQRELSGRRVKENAVFDVVVQVL